MTIQTHSIQSNRLDLVLFDRHSLQLSLEDDKDSLERHLGVEVSPAWFEAKDFIELRHRQIAREPAYQPWGPRAIILREKALMIGHIGFHTQPGAAYLHAHAQNGVEFGFTVFPDFRRNGFAREASLSLMEWAHRQHSVSEFILSIRPDNIPSRKLADGLGFIKIGSQTDDEDGVEDIYKLDYHQLRTG